MPDVDPASLPTYAQLSEREDAPRPHPDLPVTPLPQGEGLGVKVA